MLIGERLYRRGLLSFEQLESAIRAQVVYGGKLGTNLVEMGLIDLETLTHSLAEAFGVPAATQRMFETVTPSIIAALPKHVAVQHRAVPLGKPKGKPRDLAVAFESPRDLQAVDDVQFVTGMRIHPYVAPQLRIAYFREKFYAIPREQRYHRMPDPTLIKRSVPELGAERRKYVELKPRMATEPPAEIVLAMEVKESIEVLPGRHSRGEVRDEPPAKPEPPPKPAPRPGLPAEFAMEAVEAPLAAELAMLADGRPEAIAVSERTEPLLVARGVMTTLPPAPAPVAAPAPAPVAAPVVAVAPVPVVPALPRYSRDEALERIDAAEERGEIGDALVGYLRTSFACGLVLICKKELALGWKGFAPAQAGVESIAIPLVSATLFKLPYDSVQVCAGAPIDEGKSVHERLWKLLGLDPPPIVIVCPVAIGDRAVNLIYAHPPAGETLPPGAITDITELGLAAGEAYGRLIQISKNKSSG